MDEQRLAEIVLLYIRRVVLPREGINLSKASKRELASVSKLIGVPVKELIEAKKLLAQDLLAQEWSGNEQD